MAGSKLDAVEDRLMSTPAPPPSGRPRNPEVTTRALRAAQRVYGRLGLSGFTFDAVAAEAGVGKPALYRRWSSRDELLKEALLTYSVVPDQAVYHDLRSQLIELAHSTLLHMRSDEGAAIQRIHADRRAAPELFRDVMHQIRGVTHATTTGMVLAAIERGEVSEETDPDAVIETVTGAAYMHSTLDPENLANETPAEARAHCERFVDVVLKGIEYSGN